MYLPFGIGLLFTKEPSVSSGTDCERWTKTVASSLSISWPAVSDWTTLLSFTATVVTAATEVATDGRVVIVGAAVTGKLCGCSACVAKECGSSVTTESLECEGALFA